MQESLELGERNRETAIATAAAQRIVEDLFAADIEEVFALYNGDSADDPAGDGTAPGSSFTVEGLRVVPGDEDGMAGEIRFPVADGEPGILREDLVLDHFGLARDLDLDGLLDAEDHSLDYQVLPIVVRVSWQSDELQRHLEVRTIVGARS